MKSVLTSLAFTDVAQNKVLFTTVNQWFDESIFYENTVKNLYYPSVDYKEFNKFKKKYFKTFKTYPNEISILAYDAIGLIYYLWKKNGKISKLKKIKIDHRYIAFKKMKISQDLSVYEAKENRFTKF